jgi:hypothetical protein
MGLRQVAVRTQTVSHKQACSKEESSRMQRTGTRLQLVGRPCSCGGHKFTCGPVDVGRARLAAGRLVAIVHADAEQGRWSGRQTGRGPDEALANAALQK